MKTFIKNKNTISEKDNLIILVENSNNLSNLDLNEFNFFLFKGDIYTFGY